MNKVILIGRLGNDPEKSDVKGTAKVWFSLATTKRWKKDGQSQSKTEWHRIVAWGKLAEIMDQYLKKGSQVAIEGEINCRSYEEKGVKKYITEITADQMEMLGGKDKEEKEESDDLPF